MSREHLRGTEVSTFTVESAGHGLSNTSANLVNRSLLKFLSNTTWPRQRAREPVKTNFEPAMGRLPSLTRDKIDVNGRSPHVPSSFSVKTTAEVEQTKAFAAQMFSGALPPPRLAWGFGGASFAEFPHDLSLHNSIQDLFMTTTPRSSFTDSHSGTTPSPRLSLARQSLSSWSQSKSRARADSLIRTPALTSSNGGFQENEKSFCHHNHTGVQRLGSVVNDMLEIEAGRVQ